MLIAKQEIELAFERVGKFLTPTPLIQSDFQSKKHGASVFLKLESLQPTHSFKVRGAFNAISALPEKQRKRGIVCASGGNHGLGVALACNRLEIPCRVVLPTKAPEQRVAAIKNLGAQAILHGASWDEANMLGMTIATKEDLAYIHPFDNELVMAGQGTIVLELLNQMERIDSILVSIGGGGLLSGILSAVKHFSAKTKVIGVETNGSQCLSLSVKAGRIEELAAITTVADSLGARRTQPRQFEIISKNADQLVVVEDKDAIASLVELLQEDKILVEPASSCSLAALGSGKIEQQLGSRIVVIMCGGNIGLDRVSAWISG